MPVYHRHSLVHIHIPKAGGTAIESLFSDLGDLTWDKTCWIGQEFANNRWYEYQHLSIQELHLLSDEAFRHHASFAVVRNPYTRLVSDFYWRQAIHKAYPDQPIPAFDSFEDFLRFIPGDINVNWLGHIHRANQAQANFLIHTRPQYQFIEEGGEPFAVNHILRFERFGDEMDNFLSQMGIQNTHIRNPEQKDIKGHFDRSLLDRVNRIYERDFELFGYEMW